MQAVRNKIRSRRGASLTFALLLFLVCAVVGSVVLTAGTAASGRMSQIAEMDQRYYSVNSAARLLIDLMDQYTIRCETKENVVLENDVEIKKTEYVYYINGKTEDQAKNEQMYYKLALDAAKQVIEKKGALTREFTIGTGNTTELSGAKLNVIVKESISANGDVEFAVKSADADKVYQIKLRFMDTLGAFNCKWKLYDIESVMPTEPGTAGGGA